MNKKEATVSRGWLVIVGLIAGFASVPQALAEPQCVAKEVTKARGKADTRGEADTVVLMVSEKAATRLLRRGYSVVACPISRGDVQGLEKFVCDPAVGESGPLRRSLEAHFDMSIEELCQLAREVLEET